MKKVEETFFWPGDVVQLNSCADEGEMTIARLVKSQSEEEFAVCVWFDANLHAQRYTFPLAVLKHAKLPK
jgi:hypothetical protein